MIVVILAGGKGTRLWPLSNGEKPKQFLRIKNEYSLLQQTVLRFSSANEVEKIVVVTNDKYKSIVEKHLHEINAKCEIVIEPCGRNTLPAIALSVKYLEEKLNVASDKKVLISPSDHFISPQEKFLEVIKKLESINFEKNIVTFGVRPTHPETGYGYIEISSKKGGLFSAKRFIEKPNLEKAKEFLLSQKYFWNAGFFSFQIETFWEELRSSAFDFYQICQKKYSDFYSFFENMPNISFDYGVMEKTKNIKIFPLDLAWSDVGSWDSIYEALDKDENCNVKSGKIIAIDTKNSLILADKRIVSTIGLENMIIIETEGGIFIGKKGDSQKIKLLIAELQKTKEIS
jgi:mannose-1-phosphate guanylyltransferase / mannose-6-phosphate isomerase